jgi:low affinity Fe/Cu permease
MTVVMIVYLQNKFTEITVALEKTIEESLLVQNKVLRVKD